MSPAAFLPPFSRPSGAPGIFRRQFSRALAFAAAALLLALAGPAQAQQRNDDATLSALGESAGTLSPEFDPRVLRYTLSLSGMPAAVSFAPTPSVAGAVVTVNGAAVTDATPRIIVGLKSATGDIATIVGTALDGKTMRTYTVRVFRETLPAKMTLTATPIASGVRVSWEADRAAHPPISSHDMSFREVKNPRGPWLQVAGTFEAGSTNFSYNGFQNVVDFDSTALSDSTDYEVRMRAVNSAGAGAWSEPVTFRPLAADAINPPQAPSELSLTVRDRALIANWPAGNFSERIGYRLRWREARDGANWQGESGDDDEGQFISGAESDMYFITGLTNETEYVVQVASAHTAVISAFATEARATPTRRASPPPAAPVFPTQEEVGALGDGITLRWNPPDDDGGAEITGYRVRWRAAGPPLGAWNDEEGVLSDSVNRVYRIAPLAAGNYQVQIAAVNSAGRGRWSESVSEEVTNATPSPGASDLTRLSITDEDGNPVEISPAFAGTTRLYSAMVGADVGAIRISADVGALLYKSPDKVFGSGDLIPLLPGITRIDIGRRALGSQILSRYFLSVTRAAPPGKPEAPEVRAVSETSLEVSWSEPRQGSAALTVYHVRWRAAARGGVAAGKWRNEAGDSDDGQEIADGADARRYTIAQLTEGVPYDVQVRAQSEIGAGAWSDSVTATPASTDAALSSLAISGQALLAPPVFDADTLTYRAYFDRSASSINVRARSAHSGASVSAEGRDVAPGQTVTLPLVQNGVKNIEVTVTAADGNTVRVYRIEANHRPAPPRDFETRPERFNRAPSIALQWRPGATSFGNDAGGVHVKRADTAAWPSDDSAADSLPSGVALSGGDALANGVYSARLTGITPETAYDVRVAGAYTASNLRVGGAFSEIKRVTAGALVVPPGPPRRISVSNYSVSAPNPNGNRDYALYLDWDAPADDGGGTLSYKVRARRGNIPFAAAEPTTSSDYAYTTFDDEEFLIVTVQISSATEAGSSAPLQISAFMSAGQLDLTPGSPQNLQVTTAADGLSLQWSAPAPAPRADGLPADQPPNYLVRWGRGENPQTWLNPGGANGLGVTTATSHTITGLSAGLHTVQVIANNRAGDSLAWTSATVRVGEITRPGAPQNLALSRPSADDALTASWQPPADDGNGVLSYALRWAQVPDLATWLNTGGAGGENIGAGLSYTIENLADGTYAVQVAAVNSAGAGPFTAAATKITGSEPPGTPRGLALSRGQNTGEIVLRWQPPDDEGRGGALSYALRWARGEGSSAWINSGGADGENIGTSTTHTLTGLQSGVYTAQVAAVNPGGRSPFSAAAGIFLDTFDLDVDFDGDSGDWVDGVLLARYLSGVRGDSLLRPEISGITATAVQIAAKIKTGMDNGSLDIDGSGKLTAADGILFGRYLLGITGDALIAGQTNSSTAAQVATRIEALRPQSQ